MDKHICDSDSDEDKEECDSDKGTGQNEESRTTDCQVYKSHINSSYIHMFTAQSSIISK